MNNHVIDPTYFYDALAEFAFDYTCYVVSQLEIDEYGDTKTKYNKVTIQGSLQTQGISLQQDLAGNKYNLEYNFYCKSLYRINIGDIICYKNNYLRVKSVHDYDEWGVRQCSLEMIQLTAYKDLQEYIEYIEGEKIV